MNFVGCFDVVTQTTNQAVCSSGWVSFTSEQLKTEIGIQDLNVFDFNPEGFYLGFGSIMTMFVIGLGMGLIVAHLRKVKI